VPTTRARRPGPFAALLAVVLLAACGPFGGKKDDASGDTSTAEATETTAEGASGTAGHASTDTSEAPALEARTDESPTTTAAPATAPAHWTYGGDEGPEHWGELSPAYELCESGKEQSPVNIEKGSPAALEDLSFAYGPSASHIVDNGHTIQVNLDHGGTMTLDGVAYTLLQFHFHAPSEHQMGGANYPMEVHLVHKSAAGELAVVGAFIQKGEALDSLTEVFAHLPASGQTVEGPEAFDATSLLPEYRGTIRYLGSLTTPPCTEGVHWNVLVAPIQLSTEQIKAFTSRHARSNRPVQELGERKLSVDLDVAP
jgi:carbonic anhydrase